MHRTSVLLAVIMALQETRVIQTSLRSSLSALAIIKDSDLADETSSRSSSFTTLSAAAASAESFPPFDFEDGIPLHIAGWHRFAEEVAQIQDGGEKAMKARSILEFFIEAGKANKYLKGTPCIAKLQEAIAVLDGAPATSPADQLSGAQKVAYETRGKAPSYSCTLRGFTVELIPIFNVMEAICWIYTCCVQHDEILTDREAECYLYQLRTIFAALKATKWFGAPYIPSTVAAAWSKPSSDGAPVTIAFACTCAHANKREKEVMVDARKEYVNGLRIRVQNVVGDVSKNMEGNCPEFVVWGAICRGESDYRSLCLNTLQRESYKCCTHCDNLAKGAWDNKKIKIVDWFDKTTLICGLPRPRNGYQACPLKTVELIIGEGRGRQVRRVSGGGDGGSERDDETEMDWDGDDGEFGGEEMDVDSL
jgi:hypothetical protein